MRAGIARCGHTECGHALSIATGKGRRYGYYRCSRNLRSSTTACEGISIRDGQRATIVIDAMAERLLQPARLEDVILRRLRADDPTVRQGDARRFIDKVVLTRDGIIISGPIKPLEMAVGDHPDH